MTTTDFTAMIPAAETAEGQAVVAYRIAPSGAVTAVPAPPQETDDQEVNDILLGAVAADWNLSPLRVLEYLVAVEDTVSGQTQNSLMIFAHGEDSLSDGTDRNPVAEVLTVGALGIPAEEDNDGIYGPVWVLYGPEDTVRLGEFPAAVGDLIATVAAGYDVTDQPADPAALLANGALSMLAFKMSTGQVPVPPEFAEYAARDADAGVIPADLAAIVASLAGQAPAVTATALDVLDPAQGDVMSLDDLLDSLGIGTVEIPDEDVIPDVDVDDLLVVGADDYAADDAIDALLAELFGDDGDDYRQS